MHEVYNFCVGTMQWLQISYACIVTSSVSPSLSASLGNPGYYCIDIQFCLWSIDYEIYSLQITWVSILEDYPLTKQTVISLKAHVHLKCPF